LRPWVVGPYIKAILSAFVDTLNPVGGVSSVERRFPLIENACLLKHRMAQGPMGESRQTATALLRVRLFAHPAIAGRQAALHIALARVPLGHAQNHRIHDFRFSGNWKACLVFLVYTAVLAVKACARALARARKSLREP
jgi:hypothetical protein